MKKSLRALIKAPVLVLLCAFVLPLSCSVGDNSRPATILDLAFDSVARVVRWVAPGDDGDTGVLTIYDLRFFDEFEVAALLGLPDLTGVPFSDIELAVTENFATALQIFGEPRPEVAGTPQSLVVPRIDIFGTTRFFFAIDGRDEVGNSAGPSNVVEAETGLASLELTSSLPGSCFGASVGSGDFNFDPDDDLNFVDVLIGDPCLGRVYLFFAGNELAISDANQDGVFDVGVADSADVVFIGNPADGFGKSVAGITNIEGDRAQEIAIGAPDFDGGRGKVFIIEGDEDGLPAVIDFTAGDVPFRDLEGEGPGDLFGTVIENAEGIEARFARNILISAPGFDASTGRVYLFDAGELEDTDNAVDARAKLDGESPGDGFGTQVESLGLVVDDDSLIEFGISSPAVGKVYVFFGVSDFPDIDLSVDTSLVTVISGSVAEDFGISFSGGADIDGMFDPDDDNPDDGAHDVVVGVPGADADRGKVLLFSGDEVVAARGTGLNPPVETEYTGESPGDRFGESVAVMGDINPEVNPFEGPVGDVLLFRFTNADFIVGAPGTTNGTVYIFFGSESLPASVSAAAAPLALMGGSPGEAFGSLVMNIGDITDDRLNDFAALGDELVRIEF